MTGWLVGSARVTLHPRCVVLAIIDDTIDIAKITQIQNIYCTITI